MLYTELKSFENKLANHAAPSLLGMKSANLISVSKDEFNIGEQMNRFNERAVEMKLRIRPLCKCKGRILILVYNDELLQKRLKEKACREILIEYGYEPEACIEKDLDRLKKRIMTENNFPHEIGVFLDYPVEDIRGFIENKGENYKLCGVWKVYGDEQRAKLTFESYDRCKKLLCTRLSMGCDIYEATKEYLKKCTNFLLVHFNFCLIRQH